MAIKILELFGGVGAPRKALERLGCDIKSIDYVEIDQKAVQSYNAMFDNRQKPQDVRTWNLKPDLLVHGSPCQDFSIAGFQRGGDAGSCTRSSLMWDTVKIIENFGVWRPRVVIWENVRNVFSKHMITNFNAYLLAMEKLGYVNSYGVLDARQFGLPQKRERVFTISMLGHTVFDFTKLKTRRMASLKEFLETDVAEYYHVTQKSVLDCIGAEGVRRTTVLDEYAYTITTRQDRTPAQVIALANGRYRYLTEKECWRLQGFDDNDYGAAAKAHPITGRMNRTLYKQAGNSMPVNILESIFDQLL